jgi:hypothetical protein
VGHDAVGVGSGNRDGPALLVDIPRLRPHAVCDHQRRITKSLRQRVAHRSGPRRAAEFNDEIGDGRSTGDGRRERAQRGKRDAHERRLVGDEQRIALGREGGHRRGRRRDAHRRRGEHACGNHRARCRSDQPPDCETEQPERERAGQQGARGKRVHRHQAPEHDDRPLRNRRAPHAWERDDEQHQRRAVQVERSVRKAAREPERAGREQERSYPVARSVEGEDARADEGTADEQVRGCAVDAELVEGRGLSDDPERHARDCQGRQRERALARDPRAASGHLRRAGRPARRAPGGARRDRRAGRAS